MTLKALVGFGSNPGALGAYHHLPDPQAANAPLVVVLHGCTQTAASYDRGSGWSTLADRSGFALLFPEQRQANNDGLCFNWFEPGDSKRGRGEPESIRQMIEAMIAAHDLDRTRVFITGLSAGGAMSSVMLAAYPELFSGGAIIAGIAYAGVAGVTQALDRMAGRGHPAPATLAAFVRNASPHQGPWPRVSIWHGAADRKVHPSNAGAVVDQWRGVHGLPAEPSRTEVVDGHLHRMWCDASNETLVEDYVIAGMAHGTPLRAAGPGGLGTADAHMLDVGISSTAAIARFWGIVDPAR